MGDNKIRLDIGSVFDGTGFEKANVAIKKYSVLGKQGGSVLAGVGRGVDALGLSSAKVIGPVRGLVSALQGGGIWAIVGVAIAAVIGWLAKLGKEYLDRAKNAEKLRKEQEDAAKAAAKLADEQKKLKIGEIAEEMKKLGDALKDVNKDVDSHIRKTLELASAYESLSKSAQTLLNAEEKSELSGIDTKMRSLEGKDDDRSQTEMSRLMLRKAEIEATGNARRAEHDVSVAKGDVTRHEKEVGADKEKLANAEAARDSALMMLAAEKEKKASIDKRHEDAKAEVNTIEKRDKGMFSYNWNMAPAREELKKAESDKSRYAAGGGNERISGFEKVVSQAEAEISDARHKLSISSLNLKGAQNNYSAALEIQKRVNAENADIVKRQSDSNRELDEKIVKRKELTEELIIAEHDYKTAVEAAETASNDYANAADALAKEMENSKKKEEFRQQLLDKGIGKIMGEFEGGKEAKKEKEKADAATNRKIKALESRKSLSQDDAEWLKHAKEKKAIMEAPPEPVNGEIVAEAENEKDRTAKEVEKNGKKMDDIITLLKGLGLK